MSGFSSWRRSLILLRYRMRWRRCWASLNNLARASASRWLSALEGRSRLLVFDNCEHVVDSVADLVAAILAASATVKVLATSREGIGVADEQLWRVPSLDVGAAVELFVERAQSMVSDTLADEATAVEDVCRRLDGIPLAIELAASRMASMTAAEVRDRLDDRFKLLVGSRRGLERHQTLRHAVAWSYDLLDDAEKTVLERCSVFAGGFDLQSACAVAGSDDSTTTPSWICSTRWCASRCWSPTGHRGGPGFRCWRRSASSPRNNSSPAARPTEVRTAHARYFAGRETDILALWDSPRQREAYDWFTAELANLRTAFRWAADHGDLDVAATIATYAAFLGFLGRELRADSLGRRAHRARPRRRPSPARVPVCDGVAVLDGRTDRGGCPLQRRRPDGSRQWPRRGALRHRGLARRCIHVSSASPNGAVEWCRAQLARGRDTHTSPGHPWSSH